MRFALQQRAHFSSLIRPHGPAPAALASLLSHPPDPQIIRKTLFRDFPQNPRTRLLSSDSPLSDSQKPDNACPSPPMPRPSFAHYLPKPRPCLAGARRPMCQSRACPSHAYSGVAKSCAHPFFLRVNPTRKLNNRALNCKSCKTFQAYPFAPNSLLNMSLESHGTTMWSNTGTSQGRKFQARHCPYVQNRI